ncbi:biotin/lipoyl-binding protein [Parashewanella spongiae]|uniref:Biotin/lipoyl-binding protein n=1 Tax=Parashewanella spongiae TaxID=342950 RepID=A0A3A6UMX9_9GAMM|nr:biotin/lipoyl-binding protein [Parashewanella spongiae]MCL1077016.1 biotin/lipoyl-binding protein [Parashewanella spongiae]RJY19120.1 biotin/lipoyl-binding protein [Parashewanella spongiae]
MQIDLNKPNKFNQIKKVIIGTLLLLISVFSIWQLNQQPIPSISRSQLQTVEVQRGDIDIMAPVYGEYSSLYERLLSAPVNGKVVEIFVRAGTDVKPDTAIARLSNPDLDQKLIEEQTNLARMQSEFKTFKLQKQSQQLEAESQLSEIKSQLQAAKLELDANLKLAEHGIVAKIDLERAQLTYIQLEKKLSYSQNLYQKQQQMHLLEIEQQQSLVHIQEQQFELTQNKIKDLLIIAGIEGSLQSLDIELGQQLVLGVSIGRVGSKSELMVQLKLPQRLSGKVSLGALVELRNPKGSYTARISQLSSIIESGFINAEAILEGDLPSNIRPAQPVNAYVFVEHVSNALFAEQQPGLVPISTQTLYSLPPDLTQLESNQLMQVNVEFGELTKGKVIINKGVQIGHQIAINDLSHWQEFKTINIKE